MAAIRVAVNPALCQGYANCVAAAPGRFELGGDDVARPVPPEQPGWARAALEEAARRCPTGAITLSDA